MWVAAQENTVPAWAAGTGCEVNISKYQSITSQLVNGRGFDFVITIATEIIPAYIISNEHNKIWLLGRSGEKA